MTPYHSAHWMKYFIPFLFVLGIGGGITLLMASGNYGPKADAEAQRMQAQTRTQAARDAIDTEIYAQQQALDLERQAQSNVLQIEQQKRLDEQELAQRQDAYERWQALLQASAWLVTAGATLALILAASALAYKLFEQARAARQEAKWQIEARALQSQVLKLERQVQKQQTQLYAFEQNAAAMDADELAERLAQMEKHVTALQMWRLEHSAHGAHGLKNLTRGDGHDLPRAA